MLISPDAHSGPNGREGTRHIRITELRRRLASPSELHDGHRQRLLDLARRVRRVQALGDEYRRVSLSEDVADVLRQDPAVV